MSIVENIMLSSAITQPCLTPFPQSIQRTAYVPACRISMTLGGQPNLAMIFNDYVEGSGEADKRHV